MNFRGARVLVVGLGVSGSGAVDALVRAGARLSLAEDREEVRAIAATRVAFERVDTVSGLIDDAWDLIVVSPGISPEQLGRQPEVGRVIGELELGWLLADAPVSAITGTNGKTTVATLTAMMLGPDARLCGNAGVSFAAVAGSGASRYVVEASSFQLTWAPTFSPASASWTNFTPDHLDWHQDIESYRLAKTKLFTQLREGSIALLNADDPVVAATPLPDGVGRRTFSLTGPADYRVYGDELVGPGDKVLMPVASLGRSGPVDLANALLAWATAAVAGAEEDRVRTTLAEFTGLEHRQERVAVVDEVLYVNDSKATTPVAAAAGVNSFAHVVLIAGGQGKGLSFEPYLAVADHVRAVIGIGECAGMVVELFREIGTPTQIAKSMTEAVDLASRRALPGDVVLLAPGATSFDWYRNYQERGEDFKAIVHRLAQSRSRDGGSSSVGHVR
ncbi:UDP-N-acetylmuramoyl-L-alanine--D-glutamate ligase [Ferrimicrobium sp.]|uniref:UDP-N-acetylmuramoyl-L-alanine--D-glutamate ligase n=1 Tax=Ferrimicrobium sp. TaxID=2926050 RepID=UPI00262A0A1C|nr:UDP-N-acetylmuramoyl-L-alanine--D-glutamate ligase [Ferrimicrobium sp.]